MSTRKVADCRQFPSEKNCQLTISGPEDDVVKAATEHAVSTHGETDTPELRSQIRAMLVDEDKLAVPMGSQRPAQPTLQH